MIRQVEDAEKVYALKEVARADAGKTEKDRGWKTVAPGNGVGFEGGSPRQRNVDTSLRP
jgi:hypothetical protein